MILITIFNLIDIFRKLHPATAVHFSSVQSLRHVWLFATPPTTACQASLSIANSKFIQTHVHWVSDAIQPPHSLSSPSPLAFNLSQHQGFFQSLGSLHQVAKVLELQHQPFQWIFPFGLTVLISLLSKGLSRAFSNTCHTFNYTLLNQPPMTHFKGQDQTAEFWWVTSIRQADFHFSFNNVLM